MGKQRKHKKQKVEKKSNWLVRLFRFFVPKNFQAELYRGMQMGEDIKQGKLSAKVVPTWWLGKWTRKLIDPKHKMKIGKNKEGTSGKEE